MKDKLNVVFNIKNKKILQFAITSIYVITAFVFLFFYFFHLNFFQLNRIVIIPIVIFLLLFAIIVSRLNWRCPSCGKYLGKKILISKCPHCGAKFK